MPMPLWARFGNPCLCSVALGSTLDVRLSICSACAHDRFSRCRNDNSMFLSTSYAGRYIGTQICDLWAALCPVRAPARPTFGQPVEPLNLRTVAFTQCSLAMYLSQH